MPAANEMGVLGKHHFYVCFLRQLSILRGLKMQIIILLQVFLLLMRTGCPVLVSPRMEWLSALAPGTVILKYGIKQK